MRLVLDNTVSIITPLYNAELYIGEAISSVQSQTYANWEMIIIDDCSKDNSYHMANEYAKKDSRILLYKNDINLGGAGSRNRAIGKAKGKFIAFLDADDKWHPEKLKKQIDFMLENNIDFCFCNYDTIDEQGKHIKNVIAPSKVSLRDMYSNNYIGCLTAVYDTSRYGKFFMPDFRKRQDYALWLTMLKRINFAYLLNESLASYRIRKNTLSSNKLDALLYYWKILRITAGLPVIAASFYTSRYVVLTATKKLLPELYNRLLNNAG